MLLSRVSTGTALRRPLLLAILTLALALTWRVLAWRRRSVLSLALWRVLSRRRRAILTLWRGAVLALGRSAILALRWLLSIALLRRPTILTTWRSAVAAGSGIGLLVFGVVAAINGTKEQFDDPKIGRKVNGRIRA